MPLFHGRAIPNRGERKSCYVSAELPSELPPTVENEQVRGTKYSERLSRYFRSSNKERKPNFDLATPHHHHSTQVFLATRIGARSVPEPAKIGSRDPTLCSSCAIFARKSQSASASAALVLPLFAYISLWLGVEPLRITSCLGDPGVWI